MSTTLVPRPTPEVWDISHGGFGRVENVTANGNLLGRYSYDVSGKLVEFSERDQPIRTSTYALDKLKTRTFGNIEKAWTYDANGHVISDEVSDGTAVTRKRRYSWDALGRIATVSVGSTSTEYLYTPRGAIHAVKKPSAFDTSDVWFIGEHYSLTQSGVEKNRVIVDGRVIGELTDDTFEMPHRTYDGSVLATSSCTSTGVATITRQEEFTPYGAHLAGPRTRLGDSFSEHFHGLRRDEIMVVGGRPYDDEDGVWLSRDTLPQSDPGSVMTEPRLAQMYAFNFGDPLRFRDSDGHNPFVNAGVGAGLETFRQIASGEKMDYGRIAAAGVAGATGGYFFGRMAAFGGPTNAAAGGILGTIAADAVMKIYDGKPMTPGDLAMDVTVALVAEVVILKGAQAAGVHTDSLWAPLTLPKLTPQVTTTEKIT